jgi:heme-degrading monooxygenase HmoA
VTAITLHHCLLSERTISMYGTVARLRVKPGMEAKFIEIGNAVAAAKIPGYVTSYVYQMDKDSSEFFLVAIFTSKEAYQNNAASPEQNERFMQLMTTLAGEPEWHDGEIVSHPQ